LLGKFTKRLQRWQELEGTQSFCFRGVGWEQKSRKREEPVDEVDHFVQEEGLCFSEGQRDKVKVVGGWQVLKRKAVGEIICFWATVASVRQSLGTLSASETQQVRDVHKRPFGLLSKKPSGYT
jgi:hypothetical protein